MAAFAARHFRPGWPLTIVVVASLASLVTLGTWQVQRLQWKLDLIERVEAGLAAEPVPLPATGAAMRALDHRPVTVTGLLRHDRAFAKGSQQKGGVPGTRYVVPLERDGAVPVLVDLGWVPEPFDTLLGAERSVLQEPLVATLYLDHPPDKPPFVPANEPEARRWFWYDTRALRDWTGLHDLAPATLVRRPRGSERSPPVADPPAMTLSNDHLGYALTWYGLAVGLLVIYLLMGRARARDLRS